MANRANHRVLLGCGLLCAAALLCAETDRSECRRSAEPHARPGRHCRISLSPPMPGWPATPNRPDSSSISTRRSSSAPLRWPIPIGWSWISRRSTFSFPPGTGNAGRGLVKAFRYGLVMPGGSRIVFDLAGPAKIANSYVLEAANGQPPRLVLELEEVDRTSFVQSLPPENRPELKPAIAEAKAAVARPKRPPAQARRRAGSATADRDRSRPWRHRQRHPVRRRDGKEPGAGVWPGAARSHREIGQISRRHDPYRRHLHSA